jgi:hypothetical protein
MYGKLFLGGLVGGLVVTGGLVVMAVVNNAIAPPVEGVPQPGAGDVSGFGDGPQDGYLAPEVEVGPPPVSPIPPRVSPSPSFSPYDTSPGPGTTSVKVSPMYP